MLNKIPRNYESKERHPIDIQISASGGRDAIKSPLNSFEDCCLRFVNYPKNFHLLPEVVKELLMLMN